MSPTGTSVFSSTPPSAHIYSEQTIVSARSKHYSNLVKQQKAIQDKKIPRRTEFVVQSRLSAESLKIVKVIFQNSLQLHENKYSVLNSHIVLYKHNGLNIM